MAVATKLLRINRLCALCTIASTVEQRVSLCFPVTRRQENDAIRIRVNASLLPILDVYDEGTIKISYKLDAVLFPVDGRLLTPVPAE